jgi:ATP-dependent helicase HrpB
MRLAAPGGRVPLTVHLLAPDQRAVQVTSDLAGFWTRHYPALRKQRMRRSVGRRGAGSA